MQSLIQENNIPELINLCENQILKTPSWLTPYFYLGLVYEELGDKEKAIKNLKYVIDNAPGDPDYEKAKEVLNLLETK
jgi:regulator of sirC expression with transglutaminase-like and TPR domain